jgi:MSHA biogenesis protein MshM
VTNRNASRVSGTQNKQDEREIVYLKHFGLKGKPFLVSPETESFFLGGSRKAIFESISYVAQNEEGIFKVTGEVGSGKTTVCRYLLKTLSPKKYKIIYIADPSLTREQMMFALSDGLGIEASRNSPELLVLNLQKRLAHLHDTGRRVLLLIDEAHAMPEETLDQIRLISQIEASGSKLMRVALFGPEELDHNLALPELRAVRDRITQSFRLKRLTVEDISAYLKFKLVSVGYDGPIVFSQNATRIIARLTNGIPRRINIVADKALLSAALDNRFEVQSQDIAAAAKEIKLERTRTKTDNWMVGIGSFFAGAAVAVAGLSFALNQGWVQLKQKNNASITSTENPNVSGQSNGVINIPSIVIPSTTATNPPSQLPSTSTKDLDPNSILSGVADEKGSGFGGPQQIPDSFGVKPALPN